MARWGQFRRGIAFALHGNVKNSVENAPWPIAGRAMLKVALATTSFALWHSLLCSDGAKAAARSTLGQRKGAAFYRAFFMLQAVFTSGALFLYLLKQPYLTIYEGRGVGRWLGWTGQIGSLGIMLLALKEMDKAKFTGAKGIQAWQKNAPVEEAQAQGPEIEADGATRTTGVFRYSRHPLEWAPIALLFFSPTLKTNWLAFNGVAALYSYLGARHEERRLLRKAGASYANYQKQVPFLVGWPKKPSG